MFPEGLSGRCLRFIQWQRTHEGPRGPLSAKHCKRRRGGPLAARCQERLAGTAALRRSSLLYPALKPGQGEGPCKEQRGIC